MNIALSAVIIFLLLLPPITFYLAFSLGKYPKSGPKIGLLEGLLLSAVISPLLHALAILFIEKEIRFDLLALLIGGDLKSFGTLTNNTNFIHQFQQFVLYNAVMILIAIFLGRTLRLLVKNLGWHAHDELLRLYNYWWYFFNGYKLDNFLNGETPAPFDVVFVGEFKKITTNDKGNYLSDETGNAVRIGGDTMMIPYNNIINLNLEFVTIPPEFENTL